MGISQTPNPDLRIPNPEVLIQKIPEYREPEIRAFLEAAFALIPPDKKIRSGDKVLVKPNFLSAKPAESAVTTHPLVILETCKLLLDLGARVTIGDSPSRGSAQMACGKIGVLDPAKKLGIEIVNFAKPATVEVKDPIRYRKLELAQEALGFERVINLAKFKTHDLFLLTLAVKNMFGCVVGKRKPLYHLEAEHNLKSFAELMLEIYRYFSPVLSVIDAVVAMEGNGPNNGDPRKLGAMLASTDAVALDRVAGELVNFPFDYNLMASLGTERGVGQGNLDRIKISGADLAGLRVKDFKLSHSGPPASGKITPVAKWIIGDWATWKPVFDHNQCTRCGACIEICPAKVLSFAPEPNPSSKYKQRVEIKRKHCIHCFCCQEVCPEGAIKSERSWLARKLLG